MSHRSPNAPWHEGSSSLSLWLMLIAIAGCVALSYVSAFAAVLAVSCLLGLGAVWRAFPGTVPSVFQVRRRSIDVFVLTFFCVTIAILAALTPGLR